jgi:hypothetical protein
MPASKWFAKDPMKMMFLSLKGRGKWELALKVLVDVDVAVPIHRLLLVAPRDKVIEPVQSKLINWMTIMMTMKTSLWKPSHPSSFDHLCPLVQQVKWELKGWWTIQEGLTTCTRRGTPIPLSGKRSLMRTSAFGSSSIQIGMSPSFLARTT